MAMGAGIVINFVSAGAFDGAIAADVIDSRAWAAAASGLRRLGVAMYLVGITLGLATIVEALKLQSNRIKEIAARR